MPPFHVKNPILYIQQTDNAELCKNANKTNGLTHKLACNPRGGAISFPFFLSVHKFHELTRIFMSDLISKDEVYAIVGAAQILNYLKASHLKVGVLINFGSSSLEWKRYIF